MENRQKGPVALIIMDGIALNPNERGNAVMAASTPNLDRLFQNYPHAKLTACGEDVGLMPGQMGDSNVGHLNIGAGPCGLPIRTAHPERNQKRLVLQQRSFEGGR